MFSPSSPWPLCSSHFSTWLLTPAELHDLRLHTHEEACRILRSLRNKKSRKNRKGAGEQAGEAQGDRSGHEETARRSKDGSIGKEGDDAGAKNTQGEGAMEGENKCGEQGGGGDRGKGDEGREEPPGSHLDIRGKEQDLSSDYPPLKDLLKLTEYFALQLVLICRKKRIRPFVVETALVYLHRFWCKRSPLTVDIRLVIFACLILALKAEDIARHYTLGELFGDISELDVEEVLRLEVPLCDALDFHLLVLHTRGPVCALIREIYSTLSPPTASDQAEKTEKEQEGENKASSSTAATKDDHSGERDELLKKKAQGEKESTQTGTDPQGGDSSEDTKDGNKGPATSSSSSSSGSGSSSSSPSLAMVLRKLQEQSEADALYMFVSCDLALLYPPAVLGVAGVLYAGKKQASLLASVGIENLEEIVKEIIVKGRLSLTGEVNQEEKRGENKTPTGSLKRRKEEKEETLRVKSERNVEEEEDGGKGRENSKRIKIDPSSHSQVKQEGGTFSSSSSLAQVKSEVQDDPEKEKKEELWRIISEKFSHIHETLGQIYELQRRVHQPEVAEAMGSLLEHCVDAIEEHLAAEENGDGSRSAGKKKREGNGGEDKKDKKKKKEKKKKKKDHKHHEGADGCDGGGAGAASGSGHNTATGGACSTSTPSRLQAEEGGELLTPSDEHTATESDVSGTSSVATPQKSR